MGVCERQPLPGKECPSFQCFNPGAAHSMAVTAHLWEAPSMLTRVPMALPGTMQHGGLACSFGDSGEWLVFFSFSSFFLLLTFPLLAFLLFSVLTGNQRKKGRPTRMQLQDQISWGQRPSLEKNGEKRRGGGGNNLLSMF